VLVAQTIRYASQVREAPQVTQHEITDQEAALIDGLVDAMSADSLEIAERSSYQDALVEVIASKLLGKPAPTKALESPKTLASDLASVLQSSLAQVKANPPKLVQAGGTGERRGILLNA
jgi:non-homologous end joining protein Ku